MSLGVELLTDDQIVELLIEVCNELAVRDPVVRKAAQAEISKAAEEVKTKRIAAKRILQSRAQQEQTLLNTIESVVRQARQEYAAQLKREVVEAVQEEIKSGAFRLMTPQQEADAIKDATMQANDAALRGIDPRTYDADRRRVMDNLRRMGHTVEDIERYYGKF